MMDIYHIISVILSVAAICSGHDSTCNRYGYVKGFGNLVWNKRLRSTYLQFHPTTLKQCAIECLVRRGRCKSINFSRQMSFCELNYRNLSDNQAAENCTSFDYSDISTWSTNMIGKCKDKVCNKKERCSTQTGKCSLSDCGPVDFVVPKNSVIQNHGHHEIGNAVDFLCKKGYRMYNKTSLENMYVAIIKCKASGQWENVEFICLACDRRTLHVDKLVELVENTTSLVNEEYELQCKSGYRPYINGTTKADSVTVRCNIQTHKWERPDFLCKKCDPIGFEIPKNSVLQNYSHHYTGNSLSFTCEDGYLMYNKTTLEYMSRAIMTCDAAGHWGNAEFICLECDLITLEIPNNSAFQIWSDDAFEDFVNFTCEYDYFMYNVNTKEHIDFEITKCNASGKWEDVEFVCLGCDRNRLKVDTFAELVAENTFTESYTFRCNSGYIAYVNEARILDVFNVTCNNKTHKWEGQDFFCKNATTLSKDFCQQGYNYESGSCIKYHSKKLTHQKAQNVCMNENAHLLVITEKNKGLLQGNRKAFFIDGMVRNGQLQGWANQKLNYANNSFGNDLCAVVNGTTLTFQNCFLEEAFVCQFELCPETAGYTYDAIKDICYSYNVPSPYSRNICNASTIPYEQKPLPINTEHQKSIYRNLPAHTQSSTYFLSTSNVKYSAALHACREKGMHLAVLETLEQKKTAANIMRTKVNESVYIAMNLNIKETYDYRYTDGNIFTFFPRSISLTASDERHCMLMDIKGNYKSENCTARHSYLCADLDNKEKRKLTKVHSPTSFDKAVKMCKEVFHLNLAKIEDTDSWTWVKGQISNKEEWYYVGLKLHHKNYTYSWVEEGYVSEYVHGSGEDFQQGYTNDMKDLHRRVVFNATSMKFELAMWSFVLPYLCQTTSPFAWYTGEDLEGNPYAVKLDTSDISTVDKGNVLPFVCEIDTNSVITNLNLNGMKQAFP